MVDENTVIRRLQVVMSTHGFSEVEQHLKAVTASGGNVEAVMRKMSESMERVGDGAKNGASSVDRAFNGMANRVLGKEFAEAKRLATDFAKAFAYGIQNAADPAKLKLAADAVRAIGAGSVEATRAVRDETAARKELYAGIAAGERQVIDAYKARADAMKLVRRAADEAAEAEAKARQTALVQSAGRSASPFNNHVSLFTQNQEKQAQASYEAVKRAQQGILQLNQEFASQQAKALAQLSAREHSPFDNHVAMFREAMEKVLAEAKAKKEQLLAIMSAREHSPFDNHVAMFRTAQEEILRVAKEKKDQLLAVLSAREHSPFDNHVALFKAAQDEILRVAKEKKDQLLAVMSAREHSPFDNHVALFKEAQEKILAEAKTKRDQLLAIMSARDNSPFDNHVALFKEAQGKILAEARKTAEQLAEINRGRLESPFDNHVTAFKANRQAAAAVAINREHNPFNEHVRDRAAATIAAEEVERKKRIEALTEALRAQSMEYERLARLAREMRSQVNPLGSLEDQKAELIKMGRGGHLNADEFHTAWTQLSAKIERIKKQMADPGALDLARHEWINFGQQVNDVFTMAASGSGIFQIIATQAGQFVDIFQRNGGTKAFFQALWVGAKGLFGTVTGLVTVIGGSFVAAITGAAWAWNRYAESLKAVERSTMGLGRGTGMVAERLAAEAEMNAGDAHISRNESRELTGIMTGTGRIDPALFNQTRKTARDLAAMTGQELPDAMKSLSAALADPAKGIEALNQQFNLWGDSEAKALQRMAATGDRAGAQKAILDALGGSIGGAHEKTSLWTRSMEALGNVFSNAADSVGKFLSGPELQQRIEDRRKQIDGLQKGLATTGSGPVYDFGVTARMRGQLQSAQLAQANDETAKALMDDQAAQNKLQFDARDISNSFAKMQEGSDPLNETLRKIRINLDAISNNRAKEAFRLVSDEDKAKIADFEEFQKRALSYQARVKNAGSEEALSTGRQSALQLDTARATQYEAALAQINLAETIAIETANRSIKNQRDRANAVATLTKAYQDQRAALDQRTERQSEFALEDANLAKRAVLLDDYSRTLEAIDAKWNRINATEGGNDATLRNRDAARQAEKDAAQQRLQRDASFTMEDTLRAQSQVGLDEYAKKLEEIDAKWERINQTKNGSDPETRRLNDITQQAEKETAARNSALTAQYRMEDAQAARRGVRLSEYDRTLAEIEQKWARIAQTEGGSDVARDRNIAARQAEIDGAGDRSTRTSEEALAQARFQRSIATAGEYERVTEEIKRKWDEITRLQGGTEIAKANNALSKQLELETAIAQMRKQSNEALISERMENRIANLDAYAQVLARIDNEQRKAREDAKGDPVLMQNADDIAAQKRVAAGRDAANSGVTGFAPEMMERKRIADAMKSFMAIPEEEVERLKELGVDIGLVLKRMAAAFEAVQSPMQKYVRDLKLNLDAASADTKEQREAVEKQQAYNAARDSGLTHTEAMIKAEGELALSRARGAKAASDALRDAREQAALIGQRSFQAGQTQIEQNRQRNVREFGADSAVPGQIAEFEKAAHTWQSINQPLRDANDSVGDQARLLEVAQKTWGMTTYEVEKAAAAQAMINDYMRQGVTITPELRAQIEQYAKSAGAVAQATEDFERQKQTVESLRDAGKDAFKGVFSDIRQGKSLVDALTNAFDRLLDKLLDMMIDSIFDPKANNIWSMLANPSELFKAFMPKTASGASGAMPSMAGAAAGYAATNFSSGAQPMSVGGNIGGSLVPAMTTAVTAASKSAATASGDIILDVLKSGKGSGALGAFNFGRDYTTGGGALGNAGKLVNVDPRLADIVKTAASRFEGYKVDVQSGYRPGDPRFHGDGDAVDFKLTDLKTGRTLDNYQNAADFRPHEEFAQVARQVQLEKYPELTQDFRTGAYFSGGPGKYGAMDPMHLDLGGRKVPMGGGSWEDGLNDAQRRIWPGANSKGMGDRRAFNGNASNDNLVGGNGSDKLAGDFENLSESTQKLTPNMDQFGEGLKGVGNNLTSQAPQIGQNLNQLADRTGQGGQAVGGALQSTANTIGQGSEGIGGAIQKLMQSLASSGGGGGMGILSGLFKMGGGNWSDVGSWTIPQGFSLGQMHDGGLVGRDSSGTTRLSSMAAFLNAPRYHDGFRPDEVPTVLQQGEWVLSKDDVAGIRKGASANSNGAGGYNGPKVVVNNNGPTDAHAEEREDGSIEVYVEALESKMAGRAARNKGPLNKAMVGRQNGKNLRG